MRNHTTTRANVFLWITLAVVVASGASLRLADITDIGLKGSDNTYYTNIAKHWSEGERVYCIEENWTLFRPVVFEVFGLAVKYLGFNDSSIKITNACLDSINILLVFLLAFILSRRNPWAASSAAAVYALLPFTILISRSEQTHILSTSTVLIALIFFSLSWNADHRGVRLALLALSGLATGLSALTHEDLIFTAAGPLLLLVLRAGPKAGDTRTRLISAAGHAGTYLVGVVLTAHQMLLTHQAEGQERASEIIGHRVAQSHHLDFLERPLKYGWNAVNGAGSTFLAILVVILVLVLISRWGLRLLRRQAGWKLPTLANEDLPLWTVVGYLLLFASFFGYFAVRLFVPLIPLVIVWLIVRTASLMTKVTGHRAAPAILGGLTVALITANIGHFGAIRDFQFDHFKTWTPFSLAADLRPARGWSEFRKRLTTPTWERQRFEELGHVVTEESRLLVGASTFHPFPGRRTLQIGYYFGDDAVYLFDHDQPLDQLIEDKNIEYVLFTTHQTYDPRAVEWVEQQRYRYDGRWGPPESVPLGASLGFSVGEYTIEGEFDRLRTDLAGRGARIIFGQGKLLKKQPWDFTSSSFVVWTLKPESWPPLQREIEAVSTSLDETSAGRLDEALATLQAAEVGSATLGRFRLRLTEARILADHGHPAKACRRLTEALTLLPRDTTLCTALSEAFPKPFSTREAYRHYSELLETAPGNIAVRNLLIGLAVNLAEFALEDGDPAEAVDAFLTIERHLGTPGDRQFNRTITDWCAGQGRTLNREGRSSEAQAALTAASAAYRQLLATENQPKPVLLLTAGRTLSDSGRHGEAAEILSKASDADPTNPVIWSNLCLALIRGGSDEQALDACGKALNLEPDNVLASTVTVRLLGRKGLWVEASDQAMGLLALSLAELNDSREVDPLASAAGAVVDGLIAHGDSLTAGKVAGALGRFLSDRSRHDPAIDALLQATSLTPDNDNLWANLCLAYQRAGRPTAALESCRHALELNADHFWARVMSAEILASGKRWPEALQQARTAALSPPPSGGHTQHLVRCAHGAAEAGRGDQACDLLQLIEDPDVEAVTEAFEALDCPENGAALH